MTVHAGKHEAIISRIFSNSDANATDTTHAV